jgi:hypothetical protein
LGVIVIAAAAEEDEPAAIEVWPQVAAAFRLFASMETQWVRAGMAGVRVGLDYEKIETVARMMAIPIIPGETFAHIQIAERTALKIFHEQEKKA